MTDEALSVTPTPTPTLPATMASPAPQMQAVLDRLAVLGAKPLHTLTVQAARAQATPADAVAAVMAARQIHLGPAEAVQARDTVIPGPAGDIKARVYTPAGQGPFPVVVYYHGGGWVIANIDTYDTSARALALGADVVVLSCHYRQAPEDIFPAAHVDAYAAYFWAIAHMEDLNGDPGQIAVAGESAGANLATNVALMARDARITQPLHQLLVYPVAGNDMETPSYLENVAAAPLGKPDMAWFAEHVFAPIEDFADPRIDLSTRIDLQDLPPTTLILAQIDPLRSEGLEYGAALLAAGVPVEVRIYDGVTHEFFGMGAVVPQAAQAMEFATARLRQALHL